MYKIKVNANYNFKVSKQQAEKLDIVETSKNKFHVIQDNKSITASVLKADFQNKLYTIEVNNNTYAVNIHDGLDQQIEDLGFEIGASKQVDEIKAPMPGLILEISVKAGESVKENDALLILEAMKMENVLKSPREGVIKSIMVKKGETVDKNSLLIAFE